MLAGQRLPGGTVLWGARNEAAIEGNLGALPQTLLRAQLLEHQMGTFATSSSLMFSGNAFPCKTKELQICLRWWRILKLKALRGRVLPEDEQK